MNGTMKKLIACLVGLCLLLALAGCVNDRDGVPNPAESQSSSQQNGSQGQNGGQGGNQGGQGDRNGSTRNNDSQNNTDQNGSAQFGSDPADGDGDATMPTENTQPMQNSTELILPQDDTMPPPQTTALGTVLKGMPGGSTLSGLTPLEQVHYDVDDPNNSRHLSTEKKEHSHGPASGGKAHFTVEGFQDYFDRFGALTLDRSQKEKVLYLTFDCGWEYENLTSTVLDTLHEKDVPAAFFCTLDHIKKQPELIARMIKEGHIVGNHSNTHPSFPSISRTQMKDEIEQTENFLRVNYGYCAKFFRFPAGEYSESALELVQSLGYRSVFWSVAYNDWNVENIQGADYALKTVSDRLHPGAVILLHAVSKDNAEALGDIIDFARSEGYVFRPLSDYVPPAGP